MTTQKAEKQAAIESAAQTFALKFLERTYKPPITSFQVEQIWLNGVNFARQQLEAQKSQVIEEFMEKVENALIDDTTRVADEGGIAISEIHKAMQAVAKEMTAPEVCE